MKFCSHCGARVMPGMTRCPACGYLLLAPDAPAPDPSPEAADGKTPDAEPDADAGTPAAGPRSPAPDAPAAEDRPPRYAHPAGALPGLTSAEYLGTLLLFLIPVAGLVAMLCFAFGRGIHPAKRNLARACLMLTLILVTLLAVAVFLLALAGAAANQLIFYYIYG